MRPWLEKRASLEEIERHWSLLDVAKAHEMLDIQAEVEDYMNQRVNKNGS